MEANCRNVIKKKKGGNFLFEKTEQKWVRERECVEDKKSQRYPCVMLSNDVNRSETPFQSIGRRLHVHPI